MQLHFPQLVGLHTLCQVAQVGILAFQRHCWDKYLQPSNSSPVHIPIHEEEEAEKLSLSRAR